MRDGNKLDWRNEVRERIAKLDLSPQAKEEVIAELSAHLEDANTGSPHKTSMPSDREWRQILRAIQRSKHEVPIMNYRTKSLWLPGMTTLLGASLLLALIQILGFTPRLVWVHGMGMVYYWPWLAGLPAFGALGAYLSQRAQGQMRARIIAALSPALVMLIVMSMILPFGFAIDGWHFLRLVAFGLALLNWVVFPGFALLLGALPFLRPSPLQQA